MVDFAIYTKDTAPDASKPILEATEKGFGFVPNLYGILAESPAVLQAYSKLNEVFGKSSLTGDERNVVWLIVNFENGCHYCMAAHSMVAKMQKMDEATVTALRGGTQLPDPKLNALATFTRAMVQDRGWVDNAGVQAFLDAGYTKENVLDVVLGIAHKTISNYTNHLANTPVDDAFAAEEWTKPAAAAAE